MAGPIESTTSQSLIYSGIKQNLSDFTTLYDNTEVSTTIGFIYGTTSAPRNTGGESSVSNLTIVIIVGSFLGISIIGLLVTWIYLKVLHKANAKKIIQEQDVTQISSTPPTNRKTDQVIGYVDRDDPHYEYIPGFNQHVVEKPHYQKLGESKTYDDYDRIKFITCQKVMDLKNDGKMT